MSLQYKRVIGKFKILKKNLASRSAILCLFFLKRKKVKRLNAKRSNWRSSENFTLPYNAGDIASPYPQKNMDVIRRKYSEVAISSKDKFEFPTGRDGLEALGYDQVFTQDAAPSLRESFCGAGNPFSLGEVNPGNIVLDIGSGAGFDLYVEKRLMGMSGKVCGIYLTQA